MPYETRKLIKLLKKSGFIPVRTKGSHQRWNNESTKISLTIVIASKEQTVGTYKSILKEIDKSNNKEALNELS